MHNIHAKHLVPVAHKLQAWCPVADLLAVVTVHNELEMYRLSWEKHWSIKVTHPPGVNKQGKAKAGGPVDVVSLAWRPDGKTIALGLCSGYINIYDYMYGFLASCIPPEVHANNESNVIHPAHCLRWSEVYLGQSSQSAMFGIHHSPKTILSAMPLLTPIPESSVQQEMNARMMLTAKHRRGAAAMRNPFAGLGPRAVAGSVVGLEKLEDVSVLDEESSAVMNVLFSANLQGHFKLRLFGGFDMKSLSLLDMLGAYSPHDFQAVDILAADIRADLSELSVIALGSSSANSTRKHILRVTIDTGTLQRHAREIRSLGVRTKPMNHLLTYMGECLEVMKKDYEKVSQLAENCRDSVKECLSNNDESGDATSEFLQLLLTARPSVSMDQYLQQELGHHGIKRWEKSAMAAHENIRRVAFECLLPACERLMVHLTDILGYSRWSERYSPLGLKETRIYNCIRQAGDFIGMIERLFQVLKVEVKLFSEFKNWLEQEVEHAQPTRRAEDETAEDNQKKFLPVDPLSVANYLRSGVGWNGEGLGAFFKDIESSSDLHSEKEKPSIPEINPMYPIVYPFAKVLYGFGVTSDLDSGLVSQSQLLTTETKTPSVGLVSSASSLSMEEHLKVLKQQCQLIFQEASSVLAESVKVNHSMTLATMTASGPESEEDQTVARKDLDSIKVAVRYYYDSLNPWLYVALLHPVSKPGSHQYLAVLRSRTATMLAPKNSIHHKRHSQTALEKYASERTMDRVSRKRKASVGQDDPHKTSKKVAELFTARNTLREPLGLSQDKDPVHLGDDIDSPDTGSYQTAQDQMEAALFSLKDPDAGHALGTHEVSSQILSEGTDLQDISFRDHKTLFIQLQRTAPNAYERSSDTQYQLPVPLDGIEHAFRPLSDTLPVENLDKGMDGVFSVFDTLIVAQRH
ncbi:Anaphase-promoting complex subunit 4 [Podila epigama]|nr:Anaphase-promoting complex subunit 4 [Podila epigama]